MGLVPVAPQASFAADPCTQIDEFIAEQDRIEQKQDTLLEDAVTAKDELTQVEADIVSGEARVAELTSELSVLQSAIGDLALQAFVSGDQIGGLGTLLTDSGSISQAVEREQYAQLALNAGQASTDDLDAKVHDLENEQKQLDRKRQKAEEYITLIDDRLAEAEKYAKQLEDGEQRARVQCAEAVAARRKAQEAQRLAEAQAIARQNASRRTSSGTSSSNGGGSNTGGNAGGGSSNGGGNGGGGSSDSGGGSSSGGSGSYVPPPSPGAGGAVSAALSQLGVPYKFATARPFEAFDCSGLTSWAWEQAGVSLPHQSRAQYASTAHVAKEEARAGDLLFFHSPISHVGIYLGDGTMVHAVNSHTTVSVSAVNWGKVVGVGRPG